MGTTTYTAAFKNTEMFKVQTKDAADKTVSIPESVTVDGVTYAVNEIADNAFKGVGKKVTIKVPKKMKKKYTKLFRKKGLSKKVKIK